MGYADVLRHPIPMSWNTTLSPLRKSQVRGYFLWPGFVSTAAKSVFNPYLLRRAARQQR